MGVSELVLLVGLILATIRLTRLLVVDEFPPAKWLRTRIIWLFAEVDDDGVAKPDRQRWGRLAGLVFPLAYLWTCPWCMSAWAGLAVWGVTDWRLSVPYPWLIVALGSLGAGLLAMAESAHEQRTALRDQQLRDGYRELRR